MRNIIDLLEGVGLSNRKPGEIFKNAQGNTLTFQGVRYFPDSGRYESDQLKQVVASLESQVSEMIYTNAITAKSGGFGIAHFKDDAGNDLHLGRFFDKISPNLVQNNFPHSAIPGGYLYQSRRATKETSGYKPSDILTKYSGNTVEDIYQQVAAKFGPDSEVTKAAALFLQADSFPVVIPKGTIDFAGFRDYFCELLQPAALVRGMPVSGNADEAERLFLGDKGFNDCTVSFHQGTSGGLYDSVLTNSQGKEIRISTKGASGAMASAVNLLSRIRELSAVAPGRKLLEQYKDIVSILEIIEEFGHFGAPLKLAVLYGMIKPEDADCVRNLKGLGPNDQILGTGLLTPRMEELYTSRKAKDISKIIPIEHMTSAVAYPIADYINKNTNLSQAASDILNYAAVVQIYTEAQETADEIIIKDFRSVYPSQAVTNVKLSAAKPYYSTGGKGNYVFEINPVTRVSEMRQKRF